MKDVLKLLNKQLSNHVNYSFMFYDKSELKYPYWIGEIYETAPIHEGEPNELELLLTGTTRKSYSELIEDEERIKKQLDGCFFKVGKSSIRIFYESRMSVPTDESNLKRVQMNFRIKEWRGE